MREVPLSQGMVSFVDDEDHERLSKYKWFANKTNANVWYAIRNKSVANGEKRGSVYMHREVLELYGKSVIVDHIDGNGLMNIKSNLRITDKSGNGRNQRPQAEKMYSKYKGVCYRKDTKKFVAHIHINGVQISLGCFLKEKDAAKAYNTAAISEFGEFARLNEV